MYLQFTNMMNNNMHGYYFCTTSCHAHYQVLSKCFGPQPEMYIMKICAVTSKAFLADDNLGDSLDGVEALIRKHEDFDKSFAAQAEKINVSEVLVPLCI